MPVDSDINELKVKLEGILFQLFNYDRNMANKVLRAIDSLGLFSDKEYLVDMSLNDITRVRSL